MAIDPIVLTIGFFALHWYAVCFLIGIGTVYFFLRHQIGRGGIQLSSQTLTDGILLLTLGALVGARFGYALIYAAGDFMENPLLLIHPFDLSTGEWVGIRGMSFFGGAIGVIIALFFWSKKIKIEFWRLADIISLAVPLGIFWGRIGNFVNGEIIGKTTNHFWGMHFSPDSAILKHPVQIYEAMGEGILLFGLLWILQSKTDFPGKRASTFLMLYGLIRFILEWFRDNPAEYLGQIGLTRGHGMALLFLLCGIMIYHWKKSSRSDIIA